MTRLFCVWRLDAQETHPPYVGRGNKFASHWRRVIGKAWQGDFITVFQKVTDETCCGA